MAPLFSMVSNCDLIFCQTAAPCRGSIRIIDLLQCFDFYLLEH